MKETTPAAEVKTSLTDKEAKTAFQEKEAKATEKKKTVEQVESKPTKITISLEAVQLKEGDTFFAGQEVKNIRRDAEQNIIPYDPATDEAPFAMVPYGGTSLKVDLGMWLVTFPDGTREIWSDLDHQTSIKDDGSKDPWTGPIWRDQHFFVNYPQPGRANPNELQDDGSTTTPGHPDNPVEENLPVGPDGVDQTPKKAKK